MNRTDFCDNLRQRMEERGLTEEKLAASMKLAPKWKKWLHRVCEKGLARPSYKTKDMLDLLAREVGLVNGSDLWGGPSDQSTWFHRLSDTLAILTEADREDDKSLREQISKQIEVWHEQAGQLRAKRTELLAKLAELEQLKKELGQVWGRVCARLAVQNKQSYEVSEQELSQQFMKLGAVSAKAWLRKHQDDLYTEQPPVDRLMAAVAPVWDRLCDAYIATGLAKTHAEVNSGIRYSEAKRGTDEVIARLRKNFPDVFGALSADQIILRIATTKPDTFNEAVSKVGITSLRQMVQQALKAGRNPDELMEFIDQKFGE